MRNWTNLLYLVFSQPAEQLCVAFRKPANRSEICIKNRQPGVAELTPNNTRCGANTQQRAQQCAIHSVAKCCFTNQRQHGVEAPVTGPASLKLLAALLWAASVTPSYAAATTLNPTLNPTLETTSQWTDGFSNGFAVGIAAVPGGIAMVDIGPERLPQPTVSWGDKKILVQKKADRWQALVGIPLTTKPGRHELAVFSTVARRTAFTVGKQRYPQQLLTISDTSKVTPPTSALQRIKTERRQMSLARETWSDSFKAGIFRLPLEGRQSSKFGLRRIYNGKPGNRHTGLDIAAATGTPIVAPAAGRVIEVGDFYFNGLSVFVDHGQGLISLYSHLSSSEAKVGDTLQAGELIGLVGASGRVTGPHLHWSVGLNGVWVNPELFLPPSR